jgi:hypothetical protein
MTTATMKDTKEEIARLRNSIDNAIRGGGGIVPQDGYQGLLGDIRTALGSIYKKNIPFRIAKSMIRASRKRLNLPSLVWDDEFATSTNPRGLGRKKIEAKIGRLVNSIYREANRGRVAADRANRDLRKRVADLEKKLEAVRSATS